ncbi:MAG TPA: hypothetical protein VK892_16415, partial [Pyrinomonadaceae bacterium]|nr:hypothetical protein [Pyrinomonadaceae bacterium]
KAFGSFALKNTPPMPITLFIILNFLLIEAISKIILSLSQRSMTAFQATIFGKHGHRPLA